MPDPYPVAKTPSHGAKPNRGPAQDRLACLDALRGLFVLLLLSAGFGLRALAPHPSWSWLAALFSPRDWLGCSLWDLLQPGLLFTMGVAMPLSYAQRQSKGQGYLRQLLHALLRAGVLFLLGMYLDALRDNHLALECRGDLQILALGYLLAFLVMPLGWQVQALMAFVFLVGHTLAFVVFATARGQENWLPGQHLGLRLDAMLGLDAYRTGAVAFNLLPAAGCVLLGALVGELLRGGVSPGRKIPLLALASAIALSLGWALSGGGGWFGAAWQPVVPMIHKLLTASFVLMAVGWSLALLTTLYVVSDGAGWKGWPAPLAVLGRNALLLYLANALLRDGVVRSVQLFLVEGRYLSSHGRALLTDWAVLLLFWGWAIWLHRRRIWFKV